MYLTLEECSRAWEAAGGHGTKEERITRNARWIAYYRYIAEQTGGGIHPHTLEIVDYLKSTGRVQDTSTVLDIGSGVGGYTLPLATQCVHVTALDMDAASLAALQNSAQTLRMSNISCVHEMWETYTTQQRFSLAFSALCPAVCTYEDILKMESLASEACCLLAVTRGSYDLHRKRLMELLGIHPHGGMTTEAIWYYEMLYLMERQPDVKNWTRHYEYDLPVDEACRRGEIYFEIFGLPAQESRPVLREYYNAQAQDGLLHDVSHLNLALISWAVPSDSK